MILIQSRRSGWGHIYIFGYDFGCPCDKWIDACTLHSEGKLFLYRLEGLLLIRAPNLLPRFLQHFCSFVAILTWIRITKKIATKSGRINHKFMTCMDQFKSHTRRVSRIRLTGKGFWYRLKNIANIRVKFITKLTFVPFFLF